MGSSCELWIDNVVNIIYKNIIKGYTVDKCIEEYYHIFKRIINIRRASKNFLHAMWSKCHHDSHQIEWFLGTLTRLCLVNFIRQCDWSAVKKKFTAVPSCFPHL